MSNVVEGQLPTGASSALPDGVMVCLVGEPVAEAPLLKGYNTYQAAVNTEDEHGAAATEQRIVAAASGVVEVTDRVVSIRGLTGRYTAEVGDVVVGRIAEVLAGRWLADVGAFQHASMLLSNVTEPGGMLRRRGRDDELTMRRIFAEGDLFVAEVQRVSPDGFVSLHTRSARKYGRLAAEGTCVTVHASLVRRFKTHFHAFAFGISAILGANGRVWLQRTTADSLDAMQPAKHGSSDAAAAAGDEDDDGGAADAAAAASGSSSSQFVLEDDLEARVALARAVNCVKVLSRAGVAIDPSTIAAAFRFTEVRQLKPFDVLNPTHTPAIAATARAARA